MKIANSSVYAHPLKDGHRFPMQKYLELPKRIIEFGYAKKEDFFEPPKIDVQLLSKIHSEEYIDKCFNNSFTRKEWIKVGFPWSLELIEREMIIMQGSVMAAEFALQEGIAFNIAGGTHHSFKDSGEGFCIFNDIALAAKNLILNNGLKKILVIDLDVHQGNGTAKIFEEDDSVFTFSMHGKNNYPAKKEISDLDIELEDSLENFQYLDMLNTSLNNIERLSKFDFIIYQAGVDILDSDKLGRLNMDLTTVYNRERIVLEFAKRNNLPMMVCMGGGYSPNLEDILKAHLIIYELATKNQHFVNKL